MKWQKNIILYLLIAFPFVGIAQNETDKKSGRSESYDYLKKEKKSINVSEYLIRANKILAKDPKTATTLTQEALISAKFNQDTLGEARCYSMLGKINTQNNLFLNAEKNFQKSSQLYKMLKMNSEHHQTKILVAKNQLKQNELFKAKLNADTLLLKSKNSSVLADANAILGEVHYLKKEYDLALVYFKKQETLENELMMQKSSSSYNLGSAQANLAKVYAAQKDTKNANKKLSQSSNSVKQTRTISLDSISNLDDKILNESTDKEEYYDKQEEVFSNYKQNDLLDEEIVLRNATIAPSQDLQFKATQLNNLGEAYLNAGDYSKAVSILEKTTAQFSIRNSNNYNWSVINAKALKLLSEALSKSGKNAEALQRYKEYVDMQEKVYQQKEIELGLTKDLTSQLTATEAIEKEFTLYKTDLQLAQEYKKNTDSKLKTQKIINYGLLLLSFILAVSAYIIYKNATAKRKANQLLALKSLRSQMNPHFIFNALNSVNSFIAKNDERAANKFLTDFSKLMRMVLDSSHEDLIPLAQELNIIELYLKLEQYRFRDKFDYTLYIEESLDKEQHLIPPMLIQPFIENAIWHGLRYKEKFGTLDVKINAKNEGLLIQISDNGIGRERSLEIKTKNQQQNNSKGLQNTTDRIRVINELYHSNLQLEVNNLSENELDTGTYVRLTIPKLS